MAIARTRRKPVADAGAQARAAAYVLEDQVGFLLRCAHQRATEDFNATMGRFAVTPTQFAALSKLDDLESVSQNQLGRLTRMDPATVSGVVGRLIGRGLVRQSPDARDARLVLLALTPTGRVRGARDEGGSGGSLATHAATARARRGRRTAAGAGQDRVRPMFAPPVIQQLAGERLHLTHGPIDVVLKAWGAAEAVGAAYAAAGRRFPRILPELCDELPLLRTPMQAEPCVESPVARRMVAACRPFADVFVTPMAAVAGAVADELLAHMMASAPLDRAYVNDGGDIAVLVAPGHALEIGVAGEYSRGATPLLNGSIRLDAALGHRRHRHLGRARALVLAGHRQLRDDDGARCRHGRRRGHAGCKCRGRRQPRRPPPPGPRARPRQRPRATSPSRYP